MVIVGMIKQNVAGNIFEQLLHLFQVVSASNLDACGKVAKNKVAEKTFGADILFEFLQKIFGIFLKKTNAQLLRNSTD